MTMLSGLLVWHAYTRSLLYQQASRWLLHLPRHAMLLRVFCCWSVMHIPLSHTCMSSIGPLNNQLDCGYWTRISSCSSTPEIDVLRHIRQHPSGQLHPHKM
ncbi:hypothetical protein P692DRAFT_201398344 [Suillus brevipes Sb2]|nr:hypothetical protein P692DRAFT_201398344 [Suillus brevipes Sb2]